MFSSDEPPFITEKEKTKNIGENVSRGMLTKLAKLVKSKNYFRKSNQFLAFWPRLFNKNALAKSTAKVEYGIKSAKNFVIHERLVPHFVIIFLGLGVALCNVLVANGADNIYNLIPADPSSQIAIATSISKYTPLIGNASVAVSQLAEVSTDPNSGIFTVAAKTTSTEVTQTDTVVTPPASSGPRTKNMSYIVQNGDTLSGLSMRFNVKASSIQFANNITNVNLIKPGDTLKIPPDGWEPTSAQIAAKNNKTTTLSSGTSTGTAKVATHPIGTIGGVTYVRKAKYDEMQCYTFVVSQGYPVGGHLLAKWIPTNSSTPKVGGLVVTYESWAGHVAIVTGVNGDGTFTILESNYTHGWITSRTLSVNDSAIKGFAN